jgi:hypothetical protein
MSQIFKKMIKKWASITSRPIASLDVHEKYKKMTCDDMISPTDMKQWIIRKCDREDYNDWMPYRMITNSSDIKIYYLNVNTQSTSHQNVLVLVIRGARIQFDEWNGNIPLSSRAAVIERSPGVSKPEGDEFIQLSSYLSTMTSNISPPTIDGRPLRQFS